MAAYQELKTLVRPKLHVDVNAKFMKEENKIYPNIGNLIKNDWVR